MGLIHIDSDNSFTEQLRNAGSRLVVCDFFAHWCAPCRVIEPFFESLSRLYPEAVYLKINVDRCQLSANFYKVNVMPTFIVLHNRRELGRVIGANPSSIELLVTSNLPVAAQSQLKQISKKSALPEEKAWLETLLFYAEQVKQYDDEINQTLALSLISLEDLQKESIVNGKLNEYELAKNLMKWFHDSFFTWVDEPYCEKCKCPGRNFFLAKKNQCTQDELDNGADRVELYECQNCKVEIRFPRYNNVVKLLETRWVTDDLDHVWIEIFSTELDRWLHLDPCENVIDTPLMYDKGWGKKYAYVIAFAIDHVRDVTWRYCFDHKTTIERRIKCREPVLRNFLTKLNKRLTKDLPKERQDFLDTIFMKELVEFLSPLNQLRDGSEVENQGRKSGSIAWKEKRGELSSYELVEKNVIKPTDKEIEAKIFILNYNIVADEYLRPNDTNIPIKGWRSLTKEVKNIFRKEELDWKVVYLSRTANANNGYVVWNINLNGLNVIKAKISLGQITTFHNGEIIATICCGDFCSLVPDSGIVFMDNIEGSEYLEIRVEFFKGHGDCAWQHAQLFRTNICQPLNNFTVEVYFV